MTPTSAGRLRGRVTDWRGLGVTGFRVHASGPRAQAEGVTQPDGEYTIVGLPPGSYEVRLPDFRFDPAREIPVLANQTTTLDWIETSLSPQVPAGAIAADVATVTAVPPTATPVPANLQTKPQGSSGRPSPPEQMLVDAISRASEQLVNAFLTGVAVVALAAALTIAVMRRRA